MWRTANRFWLIPALGLALVGLALVGCNFTQPVVVKVGLVAPFEGRGRPIGYDVIYSARLAVREINQAGGLDGYRVALVAYDDSGDPALAADVAQALAMDPDVIAVMGNWQPETTAAAAPVYAAAGIPFLPMGEAPWGETAVDQFSAEFSAAYAATTPFDEQAGPYAGTAYDACQLLFAAMRQTIADSGALEKTRLADNLHKVEIQGITGQHLIFPGGK